MISSNSCALVVTYNRKDLLLQCIAALEKQTVSVPIYVIDNASTDGTKVAIQPLIDAQRITYVNTGANLGGAGGFNHALRLGAQAGFENLWIMDDDCIPKPNALEQLLSVAREHPDYGFLSSKVLWRNGRRAKMNEQKLMGGSLDANTPQRCRQASFVSLLVRKEAIEQLGLPITDFFIWGDDVEYTRRLSAKYPCWYVPTSVVIHKTATNAGSDISQDEKNRLDRYRYAYRNEVWIARSEGPKRMAYQAAKVLYHTGRILFLAPDEKSRRLKILWSSTKEGLQFNPKVEKLS